MTHSTLKNSHRIVLKIGSALLVDTQSHTLRMNWLNGLCEDIVVLKTAGKDIIIVSSGAISLGRARFTTSQRLRPYSP